MVGISWLYSFKGNQIVKYFSFPDALATSEEMNELIAQLAGTGMANGLEIGDEDADGGLDGANPSEEMVEQELDMFEKILTQLLTVQSSTASWSRNERLAYLSDMANTLDNLVEKEDG